MSQALEFENQINILNYYSCEKIDHIARNFRVLRIINLKNFVKEIKKNKFDQNIESRKE
jgi:hypothetical protein